MASLVYEPGIPIEDFHTIQTPPQPELKKGSHFKTRKDELSIGADALSTVLSWREYRCHTYVSICLWNRDEKSPYNLEQIAKALNVPVFSLYLGRKSCPPGLPVQARVVEAPSIVDAFRMAGIVPQDLSDLFKFSPEAAMYWDPDGVAGVQVRHVNQRRDEILSRKRWTFSNRFEHFERIPTPKAGG